jgi:hypothetical protein
MVFPKVEVAWHVVFNNTGLDNMKLQKAMIDLAEKEYGVLHCITKDYYENQRDNYYEVEDVSFLLYVKVNTDDLTLDYVAVKTEKREVNNDEE